MQYVDALCKNGNGLVRGIVLGAVIIAMIISGI